MSRTPSSRTATSSAHAAKRRPHLCAAAHHTAEALEARRLLSVVPNATLYQEWLDAPADFKNAVAQLEAQYPNFRLRFASDLETLSGTFVGPVLQPSTVSAAQPVFATVSKTAKHLKPARHPKPAPQHRKPRRGHRDQPVSVTVQSAAYDWTHANHTLTFTFSANVSASLANSGALTVQNLSTGNTLPSSGLTLSYNTTTNTATYSIPWSQVADGVYQATLSASIIQDGAGNHLAGDYNFTNNFFFVTGDLNHDGYNNSTDLQTLAQNYGSTAATYAQGDINYDGTVGFTDLLTQSQHYHVTTNLPVPAGLTSPTQTPTTALLIWQPGTGPTAPGSATVSGYNVYRTLNTTTTTATNVAATAFLDTGLTQQTTYSYQLRATDAAGDVSLPSHPAVSVTTPAPTNSTGGNTGGGGGSGGVGFDSTPPQPPTGLQSSTSNTDHAITISWNASPDSDVEAYQITRQISNQQGMLGPAIIVGSISKGGTSFTDGDVLPGSYVYGVSAIDTSANQSQPATVNANTGADTTPPTGPFDLSVSARSSTSVTLNWLPATDNVGVDHYEISRDETPVTVPGTASSYQDNAVPTNPDPPYPFAVSYTVKAVDAAGNKSDGLMITVGDEVAQGYGAPAENDQADAQYIPPDWKSYFYDQVVAAVRTLNVPPYDPSQYDPPGSPRPLILPTPAAHWLDAVTKDGTAGTADELLFGGQVSFASLPLNNDENYYVDFNHDGQSEPGEVLPVDPSLIHGQTGNLRFGGKSGGIWWDNNGDNTFDPGDTVYYGSPVAEEYGTTTGLNYYDVSPGNRLIWIDGSMPGYYAYSTRFQSDLAAVYHDLDRIATYYPDPRSFDASIVRTSAMDILAQSQGSGRTTTIPNATFVASGLESTAIGIDAGYDVNYRQELQPGDSVYINGAWYPIDFDALRTWPYSDSLPLIAPYFGNPIDNQPLVVRNWTLVPDITQQSNPYYPTFIESQKSNALFRAHPG